MDPSYASDEEDQDAAAMAQMMGFSSFGAAPTSKKRKFNHATDAFVDGQELAALDKGGKKGQGSGGNNIPLGKTRLIGAKQDEVVKEEKRNEEEIELDLYDDDEHDDGDEDKGPNYIDTSLPAPIYGGFGERGLAEEEVGDRNAIDDEEKKKIQERVDTILAANPGEEDTSLTTTELIVPILEKFPRPQGLPERPVWADAEPAKGFGREMGERGETGSVASSSRPTRRGERNERWFEGYYDPSFNENPWRKLEVVRGLEGSGSWVEGEGAPRR